MALPDVKIIPKFLGESIAKCFEVQLSSPAPTMALTMQTVDSTSSLATSTSSHSLDCLSIISMSSTNFVGTLALGFPEATFLKVFEKMLGETITKVDPDNSDACGELLNIIFSSARRDINQGGFDFTPAIPSTVVGQDLALSKANMSGRVLVYNCGSEMGPFNVFLSLKPKAA